MKILVYCPLFYPSVGGVEIITHLLAQEWTKLGQEVIVLCQTPNKDPDEFPFPVLRNPSLKKVRELTGWCDVFFQTCVSLKGVWLPLLMGKPLAISHQTWYREPGHPLSLPSALKLAVTRFATNISVSEAIAKHLPAPSTVIPNAYWDNIFRLSPTPRHRELIFVGRLVSDKGVDLLIKALQQLKTQGLTPHLTLIGDGPEEPLLRQQVAEYNLTPQVDFKGLQPPATIAQLLNQHQILVIPSRWQEPFGIVALEGIACGCVVVASQGGGLPEAIGPCGITFPNQNLEQLTTILHDLLTNPQQLAIYKANAIPHLQKHQPQTIAQAYLNLLQTVLL
ncbi:glycosyltransferase [Spirulina subsalsa FACHB-351]|uniref:Glycosyltransferase n=1 Tax=Spirulina subsalsa FACHB-351 TaxID=234711 RepID=A0ABT3LAU8_9CYAN|nr:glycosyltransferase [Spirulina subsalsa]MCW6038110.1 glycosyltransferase [Spirulina subsalsa FACHB-351]